MSEIRTGAITGIVTGCLATIVTVGVLFGKVRTLLAAGHTEIQEHLRQRPDTAMSELETRRQAVCEQLSNCVIRNEALTEVQHQMAAVLSAENLPALEQAQHQLTANVQHEQQLILHELVAPEIAKATVATGFGKMYKLPTPNRILLVGENEHGQATQHELLSAQTGLTLRSETLGFNDGSCSQVLDEFHETLHRQGITIEPADTTSTLHAANHVRQHHTARQR